MTFNDETVTAVAKAVRYAINCGMDDLDLVEATLRAFAEAASLKDWDQLEDLKP